MRRHRLDIISTQRLLWALGGFAPCVMDPSEPRAFRDKHKQLDAWQVRRIAELAHQPKQWGEVKAFAERADLSYNSVTTMMTRLRQGGEPHYWRRILGADA